MRFPLCSIELPAELSGSEDDTLETANEGAADPVRLATPLGRAIGNLFVQALPLLDGNPPG